MNERFAAALVLSLALAAPLRAEEKKPTAKGEGGHGASSTSPYYVIDPLPISIIRDSAGRGLLVVEIGVDGKTMAGRAEVERLLPRLRDLYIRVLNLYAVRDLHLHEPTNPRVIKARLQAATDTILGPDKAVVLMRQILERRSG